MKELSEVITKVVTMTNEAIAREDFELGFALIEVNKFLYPCLDYKLMSPTLQNTIDKIFEGDRDTIIHFFEF